MILITRPKQDAIEFASDIQKLDLEFHTDSLTYIKYKKPKLSLDETRVILISSMNAVRSLLHLNTEQKKQLSRFNFIIIGQRAADALITIGIKKILFVCQDSEQLIQKLKKNKTRHKINYFCSNIINEDFVDQLRKKNVDLLLTNTYSILKKKKLLTKTCKLISQKKIKIVTFFSSHNANLFFMLLKESKIEQSYMNQTHFLCLSPNIGKVVKMQKYHNVFWPKKPTKRALLSLLKKSIKKQ